MTPLRRVFDFAVILTLVALPSRAAADPVTFETRTSFTAAFGSVLVDDFSHSGYRVGDIRNSTDLDIHSDLHMSSVLGETQYHTTGWPDSNIVFGQDENPQYCGGCNGSFLLTFTNTSIGESGGVLGVAFDFGNHQDLLLYGATVTFGDGTVQSYALPFASTGFARDLPGFWGIAAPGLIRSIHFSTNLGTTVDQTGSFNIDNLTLGGAPLDPVPEPTTLLLVASGIGLAARVRRRQRPGA